MVEVAPESSTLVEALIAIARKMSDDESAAQRLVDVIEVATPVSYETIARRERWVSWVLPRRGIGERRTGCDRPRRSVGCT